MAAEAILRIAVFGVVLLLLVLLQHYRPIRASRPRRGARIFENLSLAAINTLMLQVLAPVGAVAAAFYAQAHGLGAINYFELRLACGFVLTRVVMDFAMYAQHIALHFWRPLWRLHRVHHCAADLDVTTGLRFHPGEALLSFFFRGGVALILGAPPAAVVVSEMILNAGALFTHANLSLPRYLDRVLPWLLITPAMHWYHHSQVVRESQRNFGFFLSLWDRLFNTLLIPKAAGAETLTLGVRGIEAGASGVWQLLRLPTFNDQGLDAYRLRVTEPG